MKSERRISRSSRPEEALTLFLDRARERLGLEALTLGTTSGYLIAGSGPDPQSVAEKGAEVDAGASWPGVATWRMKLDRTFVVLTSCGGAMHADLGSGVRRILSAGSAGQARSSRPAARLPI